MGGRAAPGAISTGSASRCPAVPARRAPPPSSLPESSSPLRPLPTQDTRPSQHFPRAGDDKVARAGKGGKATWQLPAPRWRQPSGGGERASGWRARRRPFLPEGDSPGGQPTPHSLTGSRAPRPSPDSALSTCRPNLPPSTSDTLWGASNADSDDRGGRAGTAASSAGGAPNNGLSLPTVPSGDDRVGSCAAQTLARGDGRERARRRGRGGASGPAAPLSRDSTDRPVSAGAGQKHACALGACLTAAATPHLSGFPVGRRVVRARFCSSRRRTCVGSEEPWRGGLLRRFLAPLRKHPVKARP